MQTFENALQPGTVLGEQYRIESVLGEGGFGITYRAHDEKLDCTVAIKEYLPAELAARAGDSLTVQARTNRTDDYAFGIQRFLEEARTLAKFRHPNIVHVNNYLEANGTAYIVMAFEEGVPLSEWLKNHKTLDEDLILKIITPILEGLAEVHKTGLLHRDIKPGNIFMRKRGGPMLIDFGSARHALGEHSKSLSAIISQGYAPPEQYTTRGKQGPFTDLYAVGATLYQLITGKAPLESVDRAHELMGGEPDPLVPALEAGQGKASDWLLRLTDDMLAITPKDRPQDVGAVLNVIHHPPAEAAEAAEAAPAKPVDKGTRRVREAERFQTAADAREVRAERREATPDDVASVPEIAASKPRAPEQSAGTASAADRPPADKQTRMVGEAERFKKSGARPGRPQSEATEDTRQPGRRSGAFPKVALVLLAIPALIWLVYAMNQPGPKHTIAVSGDDRSNAADTANASQQRPPSTTSSRPDHSGEISKLLQAAEADIAALRLSKPEGNNAYEKYQRVLELDRRNTQASNGLERIVGEYIDLADSASARGKYWQASNYLDTADTILPGDGRIVTARSRLDTKEEQRKAKLQLLKEREPERMTPLVMHSKDLNKGILESIERAIASNRFSSKVKIRAPDIAENGAVIPITGTFSSNIRVNRLVILSDASYDRVIIDGGIEQGVDGFISTRIKMKSSGYLYIAFVTLSGDVFVAKKFIKIDIGARMEPTDGKKTLAKRNIKVRARDGVVKMLMSHPMSTNDYLKKLEIEASNKTFVTIRLSPSVSKNPYFSFKGVNASEFQISIENNDGDRTATAATNK